MSPADSRPVLLSYCATFLPREMLHVFRQVNGVRAFYNWVVTRTRANPESFPYERLIVLRKSPWRAFNRLWHRGRGRAVPLSRSETRQMLDAAKQRGAALAHVYLGTEALRAAQFLGGFLGGRIVSFHGADLSDDYSAVDYADLWSRAELFLCRSESLRERLLAKGCPADRIRINRTGVPVPASPAEVAAPRWQTGEPVRLLQVCRLIPKKGLDVTIQATRLIKDAGVPVRLIIAGEGPEEPGLRRLAAELGLGAAVNFAGFVTGAALEELFTTSHLFLHPSRTTERGDLEGIPNSLLEAMAHGLPVLSTRHSGIPEAVTDGSDGLLMEGCEPESLAHAALRLLENAQLFRMISRAARKTVEDRFSTPACIASLEASYHEAVALARDSSARRW